MKVISRALMIVMVACLIGMIGGAPSSWAKSEAKNAKKHSVKTEKHSKKVQISAVQQALVDAGYQVKVDGKMGRKMRSALKKYQKSNGLKATGRVNKATLRKLGLIS